MSQGPCVAIPLRGASFVLNSISGSSSTYAALIVAHKGLQYLPCLRPASSRVFACAGPAPKASILRLPASWSRPTPCRLRPAIPPSALSDITGICGTVAYPTPAPFGIAGTFDDAEWHHWVFEKKLERTRPSAPWALRSYHRSLPIGSRARCRSPLPTTRGSTQLHSNYLEVLARLGSGSG